MADTTGLNFETTMVLIHHAITRGLHVTIGRGTEFAREGYPDAATQASFILYTKTLLTVVRGHHMSEDDVAFPYLRDKLPDVPFDKLSADHRVMEGILEKFEAANDAAAGAAQLGEALDDLIRAATALSDLWHPHIRIEEQGIYDAEIIAAVMGPDENARLGQALGEYAQQHVEPLSLSVPFLLFNITPNEREIYARAMPPMVTQQLVPVAWKEQWAPMQLFLLD